MNARGRVAGGDAMIGKVAVVTGAASGIGLALARRFLAEGMHVAMVDRDAGRLRAASAGLRRVGSISPLEVTADVADPGSMERAAQRVVAELGEVQVLCNNAGVIRPGRMWELSAQDWEAVTDVNVGGVVNGIRAFVPAMLAHGETCHVVNTASAAGLFSAPAFGAYCASKAAVIAVTEALAADVAQLPDARLRVSVLCPGSVATNLFRDEVERRATAVESETSDAAARAWEERADPGRTDQVEPDVIAAAVWNALGDGSFWIVPMQPQMRDAAVARLRQVERALHASPDLGASHEALPVLSRYYALVDGPTPAAALDLVAEDLRFCLARPETRVVGSSRHALAQFIAERAPLAHRLQHVARDGDVEFALGESVDGDKPLGAFVAAMRTDASGMICEYRATFFPEGAETEQSSSPIGPS